MKKFLLLKAILVSFFLSACSGLESNVREYDEVTPLANNEGYVIFGVVSSNPSLKFEFANSLNSYVSPAFIAGVDHHMMVLPEGDYRLSSIYAKTAQFLPGRASRYHGWDFAVQAGKINYFGEMVLKGNDISKYYNLDAIQRMVEKDYPALAKQYEVVESGI